MTQYELYVTPLAKNDILESKIFYEERSPGLGDYFVDSIISDLDALTFYGGIHPVHFGYYRMVTKRFPFVIYYEIENDLVVVHAILPTRKDPKALEKRLSKSPSI